MRLSRLRSALRSAPAARLSRFFSTATIKVGDKLPAATVFEGTPKNKLEIADLVSSKKRAIVFGVPGAFTPGCNAHHFPSFVKNFDKLKALGIEEIVCVSVNDPFVMSAWGQSLHADGKVRAVADTTGDFTKKLGVSFDATAVLGGVRSKRYSMLVENGTVKIFNLEPEGTGLSCSLAPEIISQIEKLGK